MWIGDFDLAARDQAAAEADEATLEALRGWGRRHDLVAFLTHTGGLRCRCELRSLVLGGGWRVDAPVMAREGFFPALSLAAGRNDLDTMRCLLELGAAPSMPELYADPLAHALSRASGPEAASLLLESGARPRAMHVLSAIRGLGLSSQAPGRSLPVFRGEGAGRLGVLLAAPDVDWRQLAELEAALRREGCFAREEILAELLSGLRGAAQWGPARIGWISAVVRASAR